jgi:hypothetical protein
MRGLLILGLIVAILGIVALGVEGFTFFTHERVADVGFFHVDVARPHTIIVNPLVGIAAIVAGVVMMIAGSRERAL